MASVRGMMADVNAGYPQIVGQKAGPDRPVPEAGREAVVEPVGLPGLGFAGPQKGKDVARTQKIITSHDLMCHWDRHGVSKHLPRPPP
jgi:hypothetical protein